jgi:predicted GIY-YIG superfamily endonuclease
MSCVIFEGAETAAERERCLKAWRRAWKIERIEAGNSRWIDLGTDLVNG